MTGTSRKDIPVNLNEDFYKEAQTIRNKLLMWRFRNYNKIDVGKSFDFGDEYIEPRVRQIVSGLIPLFREKNQEETFKSFVLRHQKTVIEERQNSFDGAIVGAIHSLWNKGVEDISSTDIIQEGQLTDNKGEPLKPRALTSRLKSLGFGGAGVKKVGGITKRTIPIDVEKLNSLFQKYGYEGYEGYGCNGEGQDGVVGLKNVHNDDDSGNHNNRNDRNSVTVQNHPRNWVKAPKSFFGKCSYGCGGGEKQLLYAMSGVEVAHGCEECWRSFV